MVKSAGPKERRLLERRYEWRLQHQMQGTALISSAVSCTLRVVPSRHTGGTRVPHVCHTDGLLLGCANCKLELTAPSGSFNSPCYPEMYPNSQDCRWIIRAPIGFIIQVTFVDFEVEEAQNCMYDSLSINNGETISRFCGITAKGLSFNSTRDVMIITFVSDFSIQKKGFSITYNIVAVSLQNQKVTIPQNQSSGLVSLSSKVSVPLLKQLTICFEATKTNNSIENWKAFSYHTSNKDHLSFGKEAYGHVFTVSDIPCILDPALLLDGSKDFFTESFQQLCVIWNSSSDYVFVSTKNSYQAVSCPDAKDLSIPGNGNLTLGSYSSGIEPLHGDIYNFRLWDFAMDSGTLANLSCEVKGNVINWENDLWNIPSWARKAESNLSCVGHDLARRPIQSCHITRAADNQPPMKRCHITSMLSRNQSGGNEGTAKVSPEVPHPYPPRQQEKKLSLDVVETL
ncbi:unnamed protein product [Ranitomeya imitator]|uniref:CUB domain-containing protein n=1 Tax=Ranitomeya imitator TaxID=111125 RepID=A0ABN9L8R3_9NEOB|nr:unnamed protein product [Ranitomeya imitator]